MAKCLSVSPSHLHINPSSGVEIPERKQDPFIRLYDGKTAPFTKIFSFPCRLSPVRGDLGAEKPDDTLTIPLIWFIISSKGTHEPDIAVDAFPASCCSRLGTNTK